jgi:hypothetical protein
MTRRHNKRVRVGEHDVVGGGNGGGDSGDGSWSSEIGGAPSSMLGTAATATVPAPGGVDDADNAPMAVGGDRGEGSGSRRSGGAAVFKTLFLLRSLCKSYSSGAAESRGGVPGAFQDHQGQVSVFTTRQSLRRQNCPRGPQIATRSGVKPTSPYTPRAMPWYARAAQKGSPV